MTPKGSRFIGLIEPIAGEMLTYGFNKRILHLNGVKEVPQEVVFSSHKVATKLGPKSLKSFYLIFRFLLVGHTISIVIQATESFVFCFQSCLWRPLRFQHNSSVYNAW